LSKLIKKAVSVILLIALLLLAIWWTYSFSIERKQGSILPHGATGEVFVIEDNNPIFDFKIVYKGPTSTKELNIKSGDYAIVLFNEERRELYMYSSPQQITLRISNSTEAKNFSLDNFGIWQLMFTNKPFFKYGNHELTLSVR
jgi:hypothetical protein